MNAIELISMDTQAYDKYFSFTNGNIKTYRYTLYDVYKKIRLYYSTPPSSTGNKFISPDT